jgi:hypothetical protein
VAVLTWNELTKEQQCVLVAAAEAATLTDLLVLWEPASSWSERATQIPRLAQAIVQLVNEDLIEVYLGWARSQAEGELVTKDNVTTVVFDPRNWGLENYSGAVVELISADSAADVMKSSGPDIYAFRRH